MTSRKRTDEDALRSLVRDLQRELQVERRRSERWRAKAVERYRILRRAIGGKLASTLMKGTM